MAPKATEGGGRGRPRAPMAGPAPSTSQRLVPLPRYAGEDAEGASFSIALASSTVRFGRRSSSANSRPAARLTPLNFATNIVLGPSSLMLSRISGRPIYPIAIATSRRKVLERTWDATTINLPFGRKCLVIGEPVSVPATADDAQMEVLREALTASLDAATREAYARVDEV